MPYFAMTEIEGSGQKEYDSGNRKLQILNYPAGRTGRKPRRKKEFYREEVAMKKHIEYDDFREYVEVFIDGQLLVEGEPDLDYLYAVVEKI